MIGQAKAMYDFSARDTRELTLRENEMVAIISKAGGHRGWWKGCIGDRVRHISSQLSSLTSVRLEVIEDGGRDA